MKIRLDDEEQASALALGTPAAVTIYTGWGKPFAMISKGGDPYAEVALLPAFTAENVSGEDNYGIEETR